MHLIILLRQQLSLIIFTKKEIEQLLFANGKSCTLVFRVSYIFNFFNDLTQRLSWYCCSAMPLLLASPKNVTVTVALSRDDESSIASALALRQHFPETFLWLHLTDLGYSHI